MRLGLLLTAALALPLLGGGDAGSQPPQEATLSGARLVETFEIEGNAVYFLAVSPDGQYVAVGGREHLMVWDLRAHRPAARWSQKGTGIDHVSFTDAGRSLVVDPWPKTGLSLRNAQTGEETGQLGLDRQVMTGVTVAEPRGPIVATTSTRIGFWEPGGREPKWRVERMARDDQRFIAPAISPDGRTVAVALNGGEVRLYRAEDGKEFRRFPRILFWHPVLRGVSFTRRGDEILVGDRDSSRVRVIDVAGARPDRDLKWDTPSPPPDPRPNNGRPDGIGALAHSPDGATLALLCNDGVIRFYETLTWGLRHTARPAERGSSLVFTPDSRRVVVAGVNSGKVRVYEWRVAEAAPAAGPQNHDEAWRHLASPDAHIAFQAILALTRNGDAGVAVLRDRLKPVRLADEPAAERLAANLGAAAFSVREAAVASLAELGAAAEPVLVRALTSESAEVRARATRLLARLDRRNHPERLRFARGLEVLESVGTPDAVRVLSDLASGAPTLPETIEARAALARVQEAKQQRD